MLPFCKKRFSSTQHPLFLTCVQERVKSLVSFYYASYLPCYQLFVQIFWRSGEQKKKKKYSKEKVFTFSLTKKGRLSVSPPSPPTCKKSVRFFYYDHEDIHTHRTQLYMFTWQKYTKKENSNFHYSKSASKVWRFFTLLL